MRNCQCRSDTTHDARRSRYKYRNAGRGAGIVSCGEEESSLHHGRWAVCRFLPVEYPSSSTIRCSRRGDCPPAYGLSTNISLRIHSSCGCRTDRSQIRRIRGVASSVEIFVRRSSCRAVNNKNPNHRAVSVRKPPG